jgi:hypothetical protein
VKHCLNLVRDIHLYDKKLAPLTAIPYTGIAPWLDLLMFNTDM